MCWIFLFFIFFNFAFWNRKSSCKEPSFCKLEVSGNLRATPSPPPKGGQVGDYIGVGAMHFERDFCGVTYTTSSPNLHPLDLMLWHQKNDAIHLFYTCLSSPKIWKSENQVGLIWLLVDCVVSLSNKDFLSNWWFWMSHKRFLFWHAI